MQDKMRFLEFGMFVLLLMLPLAGRAQSARTSRATLSVQHGAAGEMFTLEAPDGSWRYDFRLLPGGKAFPARISAASQRLGLDYGKAGRLEVSLGESGKTGVELQFVAAGAAVLPLRVEVALPASAVPGRTVVESDASSDSVLQVTDGMPENRRYNSLFTVNSDTLLQAGEGVIGPSIRGGKAVFAAQTGRQAGFSLRVVPDYYKTTLGLPFYAPFKSPFPDGRVHAGWMDWYYTYGSMNEKFMLDNLHWMHDNLQKFGVDVFQLDMYWYKNNNYRELDPKKFQHDLKWYAGQVKETGLIPGIWVGPWARDESMAAAHPDWFLHDKTGKIVRDWPNDPPNVRPLLDCTNPDAAREMYDLFHYLRDDVGFHYFKLDGQPVYYGRAQNGTFYQKGTKPVDAYRAGYAQIRRAIGDDFMLSCWGIVPEGIGITNGSRTGGDVNLEMGLTRCADTTARWLFLNRICWFADPDVLEVRDPEPIEKARAWASLMGLSGQMLMMSDDMPALKPDRVELLKRILPVANLRPVNLYPMGRSEIMDARFERHWETWDVVGMFNYSKAPASRTLDLSALGLPTGGGQRYIVYDFWNRAVVGITEGSLTLELPSEGCRVLRVQKLLPHPQLLSTSRHISQGGVDLLDVRWNPKTRTLSGSSNVVGGDPYTLTFSQPGGETGYRLTAMEWGDKQGHSALQNSGPTASATLTREKSGVVRWKMQFTMVQNLRASLGAPVGLKAVYLPRRGTELTWLADLNVLNYAVYRDGKQVASVGTNRFTDLLPLPYGTHVYQVSAQGWTAAPPARSAPVQIALPPAPDLWLDQLTPIREHQGFGTLQLNRTVDTNSIRLGGKKYAHGLGTHSTSGGTGEQVYELDGQFRRFTAVIGIDDETNKRGSVVFQVWVDGVKRYDSGVMRGGDDPKVVDVDLTGAKALRLVVTDAGDGFEFDHADWADAHLIAK